MLRRVAPGLVVISSLLAAPALANIGAPFFRGEPASEAAGDFARLEIMREELRFDLRPLARRERARVRVLYRIRNPGERRTLTMAFITPGIESGAVRLDGRPLVHRAVPISQPASQPVVSASSPPLDPPSSQLLFEAALGARGEHRIEVEYLVLPWGDTSGSLYWRHGILYDLSPARQWGKFGTLEIEVLLAPDWVATSDPPLERQGDRLRRTFQGLPAANLMLSASRRPEYTWGWVLVLLGVLLGIGGGLALSRRGGRRSVSSVSAALPALGYGLLGGVLPLLLAWGGFVFWNALLDTYQASGHNGYSFTLGLVFLGVPGGIVMLVANAITFVVSRRSAIAAR